jgi:hypothetical protein
MDNADTQTSNLLRLTGTDRVLAVEVLSRAFRDYDLLQHYFPNDNQRQAVAKTFCFIALSVCLKYG